MHLVPCQVTASPRWCKGTEHTASQVQQGSKGRSLLGLCRVSSTRPTVATQSSRVVLINSRPLPDARADVEAGLASQSQWAAGDPVKQPDRSNLPRHATEHEQLELETHTVRQSLPLRAPVRVQQHAPTSPATAPLPALSLKRKDTHTTDAASPSYSTRESFQSPQFQPAAAAADIQLTAAHTRRSAVIPTAARSRNTDAGTTNAAVNRAASTSLRSEQNPLQQTSSNAGTRKSNTLSRKRSAYSVVAAERQLTQEIKEQRQPSTLLACLLEYRSGPFNAIHISAAFAHAAQLSTTAAAATQFDAFVNSTVPTGSPARSAQTGSAIRFAIQNTPHHRPATAEDKFSRPPPGNQGLLNFLFLQVPSVLLEFGPRQLSNTLWACAKLDIPPPPHLLRAMLVRCELLADKFGATDCANLLWGLGTMGVHLEDAWLQHLLSSSQHCLPTAQSRELVNMLYGLAKAEAQPPEEWMNAMLAAVAVVLPSLESQALGNILWALARLQYKPPDAWLQRFVVALAAKSELLSPQALANALWALSVFRLFPEAESPDSAGEADPRPVPADSRSSSSSIDSRSSSSSIQQDPRTSSYRAGWFSHSIPQSQHASHDKTLAQASVGRPVSSSWRILLRQVHRQLHAFTAAGLLSLLHTLAMMVPSKGQASGDDSNPASASGTSFANTQSALVLAIASQFTATDRRAYLTERSSLLQRHGSLRTASGISSHAGQTGTCLMGDLAPWELSNLLCSLAKLRHAGQPGSGSPDLASSDMDETSIDSSVAEREQKQPSRADLLSEDTWAVVKVSFEVEERPDVGRPGLFSGPDGFGSDQQLLAPSRLQPTVRGPPRHQRTPLGHFLHESSWVEVYSEALLQQLSGFQHMDIEQLLWAVGQLQLKLPWPVLHVICSSATTMVSDFSDDELVMMSVKLLAAQPAVPAIASSAVYAAQKITRPATAVWHDDRPMMPWFVAVAERLQGPLDNELDVMAAGVDGLEMKHDAGSVHNNTSSSSYSQGQPQGPPRLSAINLLRMTGLAGELERSTLEFSADWVRMYLQVLQLRLLQQSGPITDRENVRIIGALAPRPLPGLGNERREGSNSDSGGDGQAFRKLLFTEQLSELELEEAMRTKRVLFKLGALLRKSLSRRTRQQRQGTQAVASVHKQQRPRHATSRLGAATPQLLQDQFTPQQLCTLLYSLTVLSPVFLTTGWLESFAAALQESLQPSEKVQQDSRVGARQFTTSGIVIPRVHSYILHVAIQHLQGSPHNP